MRSLLVALFWVVAAVIAGLTLYTGFDYSLESISIKLGLVAGIIASITVIFTKGIKPVIAHANRVSSLMEDVEVVVRQHKEMDFDSLVKDVRWIIADLRPNSGSSLRDAVDRIEERLMMMERTNEVMYQDGPIALFRCNPDGRNTDVNRTYCRFLKCTKEELLGYGWRNFIEDRLNQSGDDVWKDPYAEGREVEFELNMRASDGTLVIFDAHAYPIKDKDENVIQYLGLLYSRSD